MMTVAQPTAFDALGSRTKGCDEWLEPEVDASPGVGDGGMSCKEMLAGLCL